MIDHLGDCVKAFEKAWDLKLNINQPIIARLDGRSFHSFTRGLKRPFDINITEAMISTTEFLVKETGAKIGYTQSDEITLVWEYIGEEQMLFGGRHSKLVSNLSSLATLKFFTEIQKRLPSYAKRMPTFDARVWNVPSRADAVNALLWRQRDAIRNSVSAISQVHFSHKSLQGQSTLDKISRLEKIGIKWSDFFSWFTRGTFVRPVKVKTSFTYKDIKSLPSKHNAIKNPNLQVERTTFQQFSLKNLNELENPEGFIFDQEIFEPNSLL